MPNGWKVSFWKMHDLGNDYIVIDNVDGKLSNEKLPDLAAKLCNRRFGIGSDGLLLVCVSGRADVKNEDI